MKIFQKYFFKSKLLSVLLTFLIYSSTLSQILLDTVEHKQVGPGMFYTKYLVHSVPWSINIFEADMTNEFIKIETVKAFDLLAGGREKTSEMSIRKILRGIGQYVRSTGIFLI